MNFFLIKSNEILQIFSSKTFCSNNFLLIIKNYLEGEGEGDKLLFVEFDVLFSVVNKFVVTVIVIVSSCTDSSCINHIH